MKIGIVYNSMKDVASRAAMIGRLIANGHEIVAIAPFDGHEKAVRALGVKAVDIVMTRRGMLPWNELRVILALRKALQREAPSAVLLYTIKPIIYGSMAARMAGVGGIFSVVTGLGHMFVDGSGLARLRSLFASILYKLALAFNERVFFQNQADMDLFLDKNLVTPGKSIRVAGSGVDTEYFAPQHSAGEEGHFVLISRMLWTKGIGDYVSAARELRKRYPQARFTLVGPVDDNPAAIPLETLEGWDRSGAVRYLGSKPDIRPILAKAAVYVLPSYYREGIPRTNLEALAMGKPVITTDMPGCRETVRDGVNGFLIPPRDEAALREAMERFLADPGIAMAMGASSRQLALDNFRREVVDGTIIAAIEQVAK